MKRTLMVVLFLMASMIVFSQSQTTLDSRKEFKEGYELALEDYSSIMIGIVSFKGDIMIITVSYKVDIEMDAKESWNDNFDAISKDERSLMGIMMKVTYAKFVNVNMYGSINSYIGKI